MSPDVTEHDHCRFCGDAVLFNQAYCSEECYYEDSARMKKEKNREIFWTGLAFAGVIVILALGLLF